jgi:hypothetical protein
MTFRKVTGSFLAFLALVVASPLGAQQAKVHQWTLNRPDAHGPISVTEDRTLQGGEVQLSLRFINQRLGGQGSGTDSLTVDQVLSYFEVVPTELTRLGVGVNLSVGLSDRLTLSATGTFAQKSMEYLTGIPGEPDVYLWYETESMGLEDVQVTGLVDVFSQGAVRAHLQGGVSIPVGSIDSGDQTPFSDPAEAQLPYAQQLGSGTLDLLPGFTVSVQNERASLGIQGRAVIRMAENDRDWALGDQYQGTVWGGYMVSDYISVSISGRYTTWGQVEGVDAALDPLQDPAANTLATAGSRLDFPVGFNLLIPEGRLAGHRLGLEFILPVHQDLEGPQLRQDWSVIVGWQKSVGF